MNEKPPKDTNGSLTTVVTESGEKIGVVKLALAPANVASEEEKAKAKSKQNVFERTLWTLIMISGFICTFLFLCLTRTGDDNLLSFSAFKSCYSPALHT